MAFLSKNADWGLDPNFVYSVSLYSYDPVENVTSHWSFTSRNGAVEGTFNPLIPVQDFNIGDGNGTNWKNLPKADMFTSLVSTKDANHTIYIKLEKYE